MITKDKVTDFYVFMDTFSNKFGNWRHKITNVHMPPDYQRLSNLPSFRMQKGIFHILKDALLHCILPSLEIHL